VARYPELSAVRVTEEISRGKDGYRGSVYPVRRYLRQVRPARGRVYQEVIYQPGEAMQVDWGDCGRLVIGQALQYQTYDAAYVEALLLQRRRRRELPSPTPLQPKRRELIEDIHLEEPDPAHYDRFCGDPKDEEPQS